jgi:hypothetical protein
MDFGDLEHRLRQRVLACTQPHRLAQANPGEREVLIMAWSDPGSFRLNEFADSELVVGKLPFPDYGRVVRHPPVVAD